MQRRNLLIGMGSIAAGGAATIGTGAFTSITADRDVEIQTTGDSAALLQIEPMDTPNGNEYVVGNDDGTWGLKFDQVNKDADSKFANLLKITNNGTQDVYVGAEDTGIQDQSVGVFCEGPADSGDAYPKPKNRPDTDLTGDSSWESGAGFEYPADPVELSPGDTAEGIALAWDSGSINFSEFDGTYDLTIVAEDVDNYPNIS